MAPRDLAAFNKKLRRSAWEHFLISMCATAASRGRYVQTSCFMLKKIFDTQAWTREDLLKAEIDYSFQEQLTKELDAKTDNFDDVTFLKIVLWKTNRYPTLESETVAIINDLRR